MWGQVVIIIPFAVLGGLMAGINVYRELQRHLDEQPARQAGLRAALTTTVFLFLMGLVASVLMPGLIRFGEP